MAANKNVTKSTINKEDNIMSKEIQLVSAAKFTKETGIKISTLSGKMAKVRAISTYAGDNPSCLALMKCPDNVCNHCYAYKQVTSGLYPEQRPCLERNGKALAGKLLNIVPNISNLKYNEVFRFESHGDVINVINARNYIRIAKANPSVKFAAFTKRPLIWKAAIEKEGKPDNLNLVYSSPKLNTPVTNIREQFPFFDVVFTVYEKGVDIGDNFPCSCGPESCNKCRFCYTKKGNVAEALRK